MLPSSLSQVHTSTSAFLYKLIFFFLARGTISQRRAKKMYTRAAEKKPYDMIIVPGAPYKLPWGEMFEKRLLWSIYLYRNGLTNYVLYSGGAVHSPFMEAEIMAFIAEAEGIPKEFILTEKWAEHTIENFYFGWQIAKQKGFQKIAFASDPTQCRLISRKIKKLGIEMDLLPIVEDIYSILPKIKTSINTDHLYQPNFKSLSQRKSIKERIQGTLGITYKNRY